MQLASTALTLRFLFKIINDITKFFENSRFTPAIFYVFLNPIRSLKTQEHISLLTY